MERVLLQEFTTTRVAPAKSRAKSSERAQDNGWTQRIPFLKVPTVALVDPRLSKNALAVLAVLLGNGRERTPERPVWPGRASIAARSHLSVSQVSRALAELEQTGYIQRLSPKGCRLRLSLAPTYALMAEGPDQAGVCAKQPTSVQNLRSQCADTAHPTEAVQEKHLQEKHHKPPTVDAAVESANAPWEGNDSGNGARRATPEICEHCEHRAGKRCSLLSAKLKAVAPWCKRARGLCEQYGLSAGSALAVVRDDRPGWTAEDWEAVAHGAPRDLENRLRTANSPAGYLRAALRTSGDDWLTQGLAEKDRQEQAAEWKRRQEETEEQRAEEQRRLAEELRLRREENLAAYQGRWERVGVSSEEVERRAEELRREWPQDLDSAPEGEPEEGPCVVGQVTCQGRNVLLLEGRDRELVRLFVSEQERVPESAVTLQIFNKPEAPAAWWPGKLRMAQRLAVKAGEWGVKRREEAVQSISRLRYARERVQCLERSGDPAAISWGEVLDKVRAEAAELPCAEVIARERQASQSATDADLIMMGDHPKGMDDATYRKRKREQWKREVELLSVAGAAEAKA